MEIIYIVKTRKCLEYRLQREMKRGRLLDVSYIARGIGKTELLVKIAREIGAIIITPSARVAKIFSSKYPDVKFLSCDSQLRGYRNPFLLEEGIPKDKIKSIKNTVNVIGGYYDSAKTQAVYLKDNKLTFNY